MGVYKHMRKAVCVCAPFVGTYMTDAAAKLREKLRQANAMSQPQVLVETKPLVHI